MHEQGNKIMIKLAKFVTRKRNKKESLIRTVTVITQKNIFQADHEDVPENKNDLLKLMFDQSSNS